MLKTPIDLGGITLKNRLVLPPMATHHSPDGLVNDTICNHYRARAAAGLIIVEHCSVTQQGRASADQISAADDSVLPGFTRLAEAVHREGGKIFLQLNHAGSQTEPAVTGMETVSASAVAHPRVKGRTVPRALGEEEIRELERSFARAALRVKNAGFDGVEIHSAHGYLLNQFFSPLTNKRTDAYGADTLQNRLRFLLETLAEVKKLVGPGYPVAVRFGGCDFLEGGSTVEDAVRAAPLLEKAGICLLDISGGMCFYSRPGHTEPGWFSEVSSAVKKAVSVPVMTTGGVKTPAEAEALLAAGAGDLIGIGRAALSKADWFSKYLEGAGS